jgi:hypothetical protein
MAPVPFLLRVYGTTLSQFTGRGNDSKLHRQNQELGHIKIRLLLSGYCLLCAVIHPRTTLPPRHAVESYSSLESSSF